MDIKIKTAEEFSSDYVTIEIRATSNEVVKVLSEPPEAEVLAEKYGRARREVTQLEADLTRIRAAVLGTELARELKEYREASAAMLLVEALTEVRRVIGATDSSVSNRLYTAEEVGILQASEAELVASPLRRRVAELERTLAESRELVEFKTRVADDIDVERAELHKKAQTEKDRADRNKVWAERAEANGVKLSEALVEAEKQRDSARRRVAELEKQLTRSIEQANKLEVDAAEEKEIHRRLLAARDHLLEAATTRIKQAKEILAAPKVTKARDEIVTSKGAILADAIGQALDALDS